MSIGPYPNDSLKRLQAAELDILLVLDAFCKDHGLSYFIDGGTCLGAVRHGGFIPWDDDVDIAMPYEDYFIFLELAEHGLPDGYSLHTCLNTKGMSGLWAKVYKDGTRFIDENAAEAGCDQAIFVDVFPYCRYSANATVALRQKRLSIIWQKLSFLRSIAHPHIPKGTPFVGFVKLACKIAHMIISVSCSQRFIYRKFWKVWRNDGEGDRWVDGCYAWRNSSSSNTLFPVREIEFEGKMLPCPNDTKQFLTDLYGDYLKLPPEDERYTHLPLVLDFGDGFNVMQSIEIGSVDKANQ